jgi:hypothetical protein
MPPQYKKQRRYIMSVSKKVEECLSSPEKTNVLSTASKDGECNIAMFGSFVWAGDSTIRLLLGDNRTYANLRENPRAALLVTLPGKAGMQTEGCRIYLKVRSVEDGGDTFDKIKAGVKARIGDAAEALKHLVSFDILETRPIVDMGQGI